MRDVEPSGWLPMNVSVSALPSSESFQFAVSRVRPPCLRTIFQLPGASTVMEMVLPRIPGWSVPSATRVSVSPITGKGEGVAVCACGRDRHLVREFALGEVELPFADEGLVGGAGQRCNADAQDRDGCSEIVVDFIELSSLGVNDQ